MASANLLAYVALALWVPVSAIIFASVRPPIASVLVLLGAAMFLPERVGFDLPGMPFLGKREVAVVLLLAANLVICPRRIAASRPGRGVDLLFLGLLAAGVATAVTNGDPVHHGPAVLPNLTLYDALSMGIEDLLLYFVPFLIGRALFRRSRDLRMLMILLAAAGLAYSAFILVEIRLSPQFHRWVYGFHQHSFAQHLRQGGYRPMVFMTHGLAVALFISVSVIVSAALLRARLSVFGVPAWVATACLGVVLILCKSMAATVYALCIVPVVLLCNSRVQVTAAALLSVSVLAYPILRIADVFPTSALVEFASAVEPERSQSLEFRFDHEEQLVERARERLAFGWGGFARARIMDDESGRDISVTDGLWIIRLGNRGIVGFWATFGLVTLPVFFAFRRLGRIRSARDRLLVSALALTVAVQVVDQLPNANGSYLVVFCSGALLGIVQTLSRSPRSRRKSQDESEAVQPPEALNALSA